MKKYIPYLLNTLLLTLIITLFFSCNKSSNESSFGPDTGTGGSLARFTIAQGCLYVVDNQNLNTFSLANPANPVSVNAIQVGFNIETIFAWKDKLFIGSQSAMYIYSIANPSTPRYLGEASHVRACDPVVANDSVAYVTVRSSSSCGGNINSLFVYDFRDALNPVQMDEIGLTNPQGLGLQGNTLFVCDNQNGLVVYSLEYNYYKPQRVAVIEGETFYDCIPDGNMLICMIEGGTAIYDISDRANIKQVAKITN
jgi:hypothetical protein